MSTFESVTEQYESSLIEGVLVTHFNAKALDILTNPLAHEGFYAQLDIANDATDVLGYVQINDKDWNSRNAVDVLIDKLLDKSTPVVVSGSMGYSHEIISSRFRNSLGRVLIKLIKFQKTAVAGMDGEISAEYLGQTLAYDARIATPNTYFYFDNLNTGIPVSPGVTLLMPKYIGIGKTMSLVRRAERIDAEEALSLGLITEIVDSKENLIKRSVKIVKEASEKHSHVIRYFKAHILPPLSEVNQALDLYYDALAKSVIKMRQER